MPRIVAVVLGVGCVFCANMNNSDPAIILQGALHATIERKTNVRFKRSKIKLYIAKRNGGWIRDRDVRDLKQGDPPLNLQGILAARNLLNPADDIGDVRCGLPILGQEEHFDVVVRVPTRIRKILRVVYARQICYYKMLDYKDLAICSTIWSSVSAVISLIVGVYLCSPARGELAGRVLPILMWFLAAWSVVLVHARVYFVTKRDRLRRVLRRPENDRGRQQNAEDQRGAFRFGMIQLQRL